MSHAITRGPGYLQEGWRRIREPGLRRFVVIPLVLNLLVFAAFITLAVRRFASWMEQAVPQLPQWLGFLEWLLWPLFALVLLLALFLSFSLVANLIASPFYGFLAERIAERERGVVSAAPGVKELLLVAPRSIAREFRKIAYYLPRLLGLLLLSLIPVVNLVASPLLLLFGVWMMSIQYLDYQADNDQVSFTDMLRWMRGHRALSLGFGLPVYLGMLIPLVNLLVMPAAVAGSTLLWVRERPRRP